MEEPLVRLVAVSVFLFTQQLWTGCSNTVLWYWPKTAMFCGELFTYLLYCVLTSDDDIEASGSGSDDVSHSGSGADWANQRSFYNPNDFDYGLSFDVLSRPPVEVVTGRIHHGDDGGLITVDHPPSSHSSCPLRPSLQLLFLLVIITLLLTVRRCFAAVDKSRSYCTC